MPQNPQMRTFATLRAVAQLQSEMAANMEELNALDPDAARAFVEVLAGLVGLTNGHAAKPKGREDSATYDRVAAVFVEHGNIAFTKPDLAALAGITRSALHTLLYTTRPKAFVREKGPEGVKGVVVSLTPEAYQEAMAKAKKN